MQKVNLRCKYHSKYHLKKPAKSNHVDHGCGQQLYSLPHSKNVEHSSGKNLCFFKEKPENLNVSCTLIQNVEA